MAYKRKPSEIHLVPCMGQPEQKKIDSYLAKSARHTDECETFKSQKQFLTTCNVKRRLCLHGKHVPVRWLLSIGIIFSAYEIPKKAHTIRTVNDSERMRL